MKANILIEDGTRVSIFNLARVDYYDGVVTFTTVGIRDAETFADISHCRTSYNVRMLEYFNVTDDSMFYPTITFRNGRYRHCGTRSFSMTRVDYMTDNELWKGEPRSVHFCKY